MRGGEALHQEAGALQLRHHAASLCVISCVFSAALLLSVCVCEIAFDYRASLHFITAAAALYSTLKTQAASTFKDVGY